MNSAAAAQFWEEGWSLSSLHEELRSLQSTVRSRPIGEEAVEQLDPSVDSLWRHADEALDSLDPVAGRMLYEQIGDVASGIEAYTEYEFRIATSPPTTPTQFRHEVKGRTELWEGMNSGVNNLLWEVRAMLDQ